MAADPKKSKEKETEAAEGDEQESAGGSKKKKLFMMIGAVVLLMAISIGGTLLAVNLMSDNKSDSTEQGDQDSDDEEDEEDEDSEDKDEDSEDEGESEVEALAPAIYFTMQPNFTVNFNVDGRQRYLQAEITLLYRNPEVESLLTLHMPAIRNQLVMLLGGKSFEELQNHESREKLKVESLAAIQSILDKENAALKQKDESAKEEGEEEDEDEEEDDSEKLPPLVVEQVLFTRFVMQ